MSLVPQTLVDRGGIVASSLCAIHCVLTPVITSALSLGLAAGWQSNSTEWTFSILSLGFGIAGLLPGYFRQHRNGTGLRFFTAGALLLLLGRALLKEGKLELLFVVCGAACIVIAHIVNLRMCRACAVCKQHDARPE